MFRTYTDSSGSQNSFKYPEMPIRFGQWMNFVFKFRHSLDSSGLLQVWLDGNQIVDYSGPIDWNVDASLSKRSSSSLPVTSCW